MAVKVYTGGVRKAWGCSDWLEHKLFLYESLCNELILLDDLDLLAVFPLQLADPVVAGLNNRNARIAVYQSQKLSLFEPETHFGQRTRWKKRGTQDVSSFGLITSLSWISSDDIVIANANGICSIWNTASQLVSWSQNIGHRQVTSPCEEPNHFLSYDDDSSIAVAVSLDVSQKHFTFSKIDCPSVLKCWFVQRDVVAVLTGSSLFLWQVSSSSLIASIALNGSQPAVLGLGESIDLLLDKRYQLDLVSLKLAEHPSYFSKQIKCELNTSSRFYEFLSGSVVVRTKKAILGTIDGTHSSSAPCLSCGEDLILAGSNIFTNRPNFGVTLTLPKLFSHVCVVSSKEYVGIEGTNIYYFTDGEVSWQQELTNLPLSLSVDTEIYVGFLDSILILTLKGEQVEEIKLEFQIERVAAWRQLVVVVGHKQVQVWDLRLRNLCYSMEYESRGLNSLAVSSTHFVLSNSQMLQVWTLKGDLCWEQLNSETISECSWSPSSKLLAVLIGERIYFYGFFSRLGKQLILLGEANLGVMSTTNAKLCWPSENQLVIFNGQQLALAELSIDSASHKAAQQYNLGDIASTASLVTLLSHEVPIYHPKVLLLCLRALRPDIVCIILDRLVKESKFADINDYGTVLLDPLLNLSKNSLSQGPEETVSGHLITMQANVSGLTDEELNQLNVLIKVMMVETLDNYGVCALALHKLGYKEQSWVYAWLSTSKPVLQNHFDEELLKVWLDDEMLKGNIEQVARQKFAETRDPTEVSHYYLALHKLDVLQTLWRISGGHPEYEKTVKLLKNDFTTERWKTAAQKNAYALMGRHRVTYAAAFFLLGGSVTDSCQLCLNKLDNLPLAIAIARAYDGDSGAGVKMLTDRCTGWAQIFLKCLSGDLQTTNSLDASDWTQFWVYIAQGTSFDDSHKDKWRHLLGDIGVPSIITSVLIDSLEQKTMQRKEKGAEKVREVATPGQEPEREEVQTQNSSQVDSQDSQNSGFSDWKMPSNLKPPPEQLQLEPDMSAFGF